MAKRKRTPVKTDAQVRAIASLYEEAQARLERLVREALERGAKGTAAWRQAQLDAVRKVLSDLQDAAVPRAAAAAAEAYGIGARAAEQAFAGPAPAWSGVHQRAVDVLADNMVHRLNEAAVEVGRRTEDAFRRAALRETAVGIAGGQTRKEVTEALIRKIVDDGITDALTGFVDKSGRRWPLDAYAKMVARTTTREAVTAGTVNRLLERGEEIVEISSHADPCPICEDYDGGTYSLTGASADFPVLDQTPPFHPNCGHVLTPAAANLEAFEAALTAA